VENDNIVEGVDPIWNGIKEDDVDTHVENDNIDEVVPEGVLRFVS